MKIFSLLTFNNIDVMKNITLITVNYSLGFKSNLYVFVFTATNELINFIPKQVSYSLNYSNLNPYVYTAALITATMSCTHLLEINCVISEKFIPLK